LASARTSTSMRAIERKFAGVISRSGILMSNSVSTDHFGATWNLRLVGGGVAHTGCVAFGIDRLTLALFATHGLDLPHWPIAVRKALGI
jgi:hypothetical protein